MNSFVFILSLIVVIVTPSLLHFGFKLQGKKLKTILGLDMFAFAAIMAVFAISLFTGRATAETEAVTNTVSSSAAGLGYLSAALVTGLASIGAGIAVAAAASSAIGAISEDPKVMGKALIFVALAEGIALYGLLVSFTILGRL